LIKKEDSMLFFYGYSNLNYFACLSTKETEFVYLWETKGC